MRQGTKKVISDKRWINNPMMSSEEWQRTRRNEPSKAIKVDNDKKMKSIIRKAKDNGATVVEIDGTDILSWKSYAEAVVSGFGLPGVDKTYLSERRYFDFLLECEEEDFIREYREIICRQIKAVCDKIRDDEGRPTEVENPIMVLVIYNYSSFMRNNLKLKDEVMKDLSADILWYYESHFKLYLVD